MHPTLAAIFALQLALPLLLPASRAASAPGCPCCYTVLASQGPYNVIEGGPNSFKVSLDEFLCANAFESATTPGDVTTVTPFAGGQQVVIPCPNAGAEAVAYTNTTCQRLGAALDAGCQYASVAISPKAGCSIDSATGTCSCAPAGSAPPAAAPVSSTPPPSPPTLSPPPCRICGGKLAGVIIGSVVGGCLVVWLCYWLWLHGKSLQTCCYSGGYGTPSRTANGDHNGAKRTSSTTTNAPAAIASVAKSKNQPGLELIAMHASSGPAGAREAKNQPDGLELLVPHVSPANHTYLNPATPNNAAIARHEQEATGALSATPAARLTVFISYCQFDKHHAERVRRLAEQLQRDNIYVIVDYKNKYQSWPAFVGQMLNDGTKVIVACDEHYERYSLKEPTAADEVGAGTHDEYTNILNRVYEEQNLSGWLVPVIFRPPGNRNHVPAQIRKFNYYTLVNEQNTWVGYQTLVERLGSVPAFAHPLSHSPPDPSRAGVVGITGAASPEQRTLETKLTDQWLKEIQDPMDTIADFTETSADHYAKFRAYRGGDDSPQAERLKKIERARRVLQDFWRTAYKYYMDGMLPPDFFSKSNVWCERGNHFRLLVEPFHIANYYRQELWKQWPVGNRHYLEADNRPEYYTFLELLYEEHYKTAPPSSTEHALQEMDAIEANLC